MTSSTLQFVVAGALIAAWGWMLGRPILTSLFRRSRRDSVGHFRYQQAVLSRPAVHESKVWWSLADRPRPVADWRAQPIERRRLQMLMGFAMATFVSLLLAIALRGTFVRLSVIMVICFVTYLGVAVYIGSTQLRRLEAYRRQVEASAARRQAATSAVERQNLASSILEGDVPGILATLNADGPLDGAVGEDTGHHSQGLVQEGEAPDDMELFGKGIFDDDFYEPIPELTFRPLNLDASLVQPADEARPVFAADPESDDEIDLRIDGSEEVGPEHAPAEQFEDQADDEVDHEFDDQVDDEVDQGLDHEVDLAAETDETRTEPTFTAPPPSRTRPPKRNKARPIYIEAQLDDGDKQAKAVND